MHWTLDQLRTFSVVAELGTMTAAAERLGYTTGAISQQMSALQSTLARPLFVKSGRVLTLTDTGRILRHHARLVLDAEHRAEAALSGPETAHETVVILGVFGSAAVSAIRPVTEQLRRVAPNVDMRALEVDVERMPQAVLANEIDIALGLNYSDAPVPPQRGIVSTLLRREPFHMVLPPAARELLDAPGQLLAYANEAEWILPPIGSSFGRATRLACAAADIEPHVIHTVTDTAVSIAMAESGIGITLATPLMMVLHPTDTPVAPLPGGSTRDIVAIARSAALERSSVAAVRDALAHVFRNGGADSSNARQGAESFTPS
ncbi:LysR family transcriptional regulator [Streptomyces sp. ISL-90]|nr:LysR family transcriptional regulator [Streptomyces sp. ISL-90]